MRLKPTGEGPNTHPLLLHVETSWGGGEPPYEFIGFGALDDNFPYEFIVMGGWERISHEFIRSGTMEAPYKWVLSMDHNFRYKFIGLRVMDGQFPYEFIGFGAMDYNVACALIGFGTMYGNCAVEFIAFLAMGGDFDFNC